MPDVGLDLKTLSQNRVRRLANWATQEPLEFFLIKDYYLKEAISNDFSPRQARYSFYNAEYCLNFWKISDLNIFLLNDSFFFTLKLLMAISLLSQILDIIQWQISMAQWTSSLTILAQT